MPLTDAKVRRADPAEKPYKLADGGGLYLFVTPTGAKSWRMKYRIGGKEKRLTFGLYPEVSLSEARAERDEARRRIRGGADPAKDRAMAKLQHGGAATFESVARDWHQRESPRWAPVHAGDVLRSFERDVFPQIGDLPITEIDAPLLLRTLRKVEDRGAIETAKRLRQRMSAVFVDAIAQGIGRDDPAATVERALRPLPAKGRQPAVTDPDELRRLLTAVEVSTASPVTKAASTLLALTAVRPGVVLGARWDEFEDLEGDSPQWRVPASRMKLRRDRKADAAFDHLVPLGPAAVQVLAGLRPLTGHLPIVFPNQRKSREPMSENAIGYLYNRVGYHGRHVPHGWRASFSTIMNERAERAGRASDRQVIDLMLAHTPKDRVEGAYNRAAFMPRRREIAEEWAMVLLGVGDRR